MTLCLDEILPREQFRCWTKGQWDWGWDRQPPAQPSRPLTSGEAEWVGVVCRGLPAPPDQGPTGAMGCGCRVGKKPISPPQTHKGDKGTGPQVPLKYSLFNGEVFIIGTFKQTQKLRECMMEAHGCITWFQKLSIYGQFYFICSVSHLLGFFF